jgi:DtxR family manganese transport transcriptional regulator
VRTGKEARIPAAKRQAAALRHTREARRSALAEDYERLIADLSASRGRPVRAVDLIGRLGVAQPTVAKVLARLRREGLISSEARAELRLTQRGRALAFASKKRHQIVLAFLLRLGVPQEVAERDAEGLEHHMSEATLSALETFIKRKSPRSQQGQLSLFKGATRTVSV